jgi:succinoglycan biosynthesis transport protein ExoP
MAEAQEDLHFLDYWRVIRSRKEIVIAVFLLVVLTGILVTYSMPKVYMSSVLIQVKEERPDPSAWGQESGRFDPLFLRTVFEIIQSGPVIEDVVRRRELDKKLARAYGFDHLPSEKAFQRAVAIVRQSLKVQQYRDTNLIECQMYLSEPKDSVTLEVALAADMVAQVYKEQSSARSRRTSEAALKAMQALLEERRKAVAAATDEVERIRTEYKIDVMASSSSSDTSMKKRSLAMLDESLIQARAQLAERKAKNDRVAKLTPDELRDVGHLIVTDRGLESLVAAKRELEVQLSRMLMDSLGPMHPDVKGANAAITEINKKLDEAVKALRFAVQTEYEAAQAKVTDLDKMVDDLKAQDRVAEGSEYRAFNKALEEQEHAKKIRDALESRYLMERIAQSVPRTTVEIIEAAKPPDADDVVSPKLLVNIMLSIMAGLFCGLGLAYFVEYVDTSVKTVEDVERTLQVKVVGIVPQKVRAFVEKGADGAHAEAYRSLRANLQFSEKFKQGKTLCVTSGSVAEGKSLTVFNLAYVCAQLGDNVLLVDSDLHRPRQHKILGLSNRTGLANVLVGEVSLDQAIQGTRLANFHFLPSGRLASGVHGLLDTRRMRELVKELKQRYDLILFDAPPVIGVSDASLLVREVDGVLQVIQHRKYPRSVSSRAKNMIESVGGNLLGVVLNNINISRDYSYYYRYQNYYYPKSGKESGKDVENEPAAPSVKA